MRSNAYIIVSCDTCDNSTEVQLTATTSGWDDRGMNRKLQQEGWTTGENGDSCDECQGK